MHGKTHIALVTAIAVLSASLTATAADYYLKSGVTDWSQASSYCTDSARTEDATVLPGENDTIYAPSGTFGRYVKGGAGYYGEPAVWRAEACFRRDNLAALLAIECIAVHFRPGNGGRR